MNDFFNTLGIEATKEEKKIKKAYPAYFDSYKDIDKLIEASCGESGR